MTNRDNNGQQQPGQIPAPTPEPAKVAQPGDQNPSNKPGQPAQQPDKDPKSKQ